MRHQRCITNSSSVDVVPFLKLRVSGWGSITCLLLGAFTKLRKATINLAMSVRPSVRMEQLGSHWTDFHEMWHLSIFRKFVEKFQYSLKSDKNDGYFTWRPIYIFLSYLAQFFLEWKVFQKKRRRENRNTHFMFNNFFFSKIVPLTR
jgi:hypothetical protein